MNTFVCFLLHAHEPLGVIFERVQYEKWIVKDTLVSRD